MIIFCHIYLFIILLLILFYIFVYIFQYVFTYYFYLLIYSIIYVFFIFTFSFRSFIHSTNIIMLTWRNSAEFLYFISQKYHRLGLKMQSRHRMSSALMVQGSSRTTVSSPTVLELLLYTPMEICAILMEFQSPSQQSSLMVIHSILASPPKLQFYIPYCTVTVLPTCYYCISFTSKPPQRSQL